MVKDAGNGWYEITFSGPGGRDAPFVLFLLCISVRLFWVKQLAEIKWIFREKLH